MAKPTSGVPEPPSVTVERLAREVAIDAAGVGTFDWDLVTGRLAWDDRLIEMFGYSRARSA